MGKKRNRETWEHEDNAISKLEKDIEEDLKRKVDPEIFSTMETVFDKKTQEILFKFIQQGKFKQIEGAISTGKEANVYYCPGNPPIACKIYRINSPAFKKMKIYVEGDHRFQSYRKSRVGFIKEWAKKEFKNLKKMDEVGIPVPKPIDVERNVLLMEFLGNGEHALPKLVEAEITSYARLYKEVMKGIQIMYQEAKLVHGDLSPFNILLREEDQKYFIIDVSQSVLISHPNADLFLIRDVVNMNEFFADAGIDTFDEKRLLKWITGHSIDEGRILLAKNFQID